MKLQDYNCILWHILGKINIRADILYKRWQQRYKNSQEWAMNKKNSYESKSDNIQKKPSSRRNYIIEENLKKQHKRISSIEINRKK